MELRGTRLSSWSAELTLRTTSVEMPSVSPTREAHLRGKCLRYTRGSWIWHHANPDARTSAPFAPLPLGQGAMRLPLTVPRVFRAVENGFLLREFQYWFLLAEIISSRRSKFIKMSSHQNFGKIQEKRTKRSAGNGQLETDNERKHSCDCTD